MSNELKPMTLLKAFAMSLGVINKIVGSGEPTKTNLKKAFKAVQVAEDYAVIMFNEGYLQYSDLRDVKGWLGKIGIMFLLVESGKVEDQFVEDAYASMNKLADFVSRHAMLWRRGNYWEREVDDDDDDFGEQSFAM